MPDNSLSLYEIESGLQTIIEARAAAEDDGAPPDELAAIDQALQEYLAREVRKVDGTAKAILAFQAAADAANAESERLADRALRHYETAQRIKDHALQVMLSQEAQCNECGGAGFPDAPDGDTTYAAEDLITCRSCGGTGRVPSPIKKLETPTHFLRVQNNGGVEALETDMETLPDDFKLYTATVSGTLVKWLHKMLMEVELEQNQRIIRMLDAATVTPDTNGIREALKRGDAVPGARLVERGKHLRVG